MEKHRPDFLLLCSSLATVHTRTQFGQAAYVAANDFLDAFAQYRALKEDVFVASVNWDAWREVGMAVDAVRKRGGRKEALRNGLSRREGVDVFKLEEEKSAAYHISMPFRAAGAIDMSALTRAFNEIIRRHEVLRTVFRDPGENPAHERTRGPSPEQVVLPRLTLDPPVLDIRGLPEKERETKAKQIASDAGREPFDLSKGPLIRARVVRMADREHLLVIVVHHIVFDGWSAGVFFREFKQLYEAFSRGEASPLPELPVQYADFAHWQRDRLTGENLEAHLRYWKKRLSGAPSRLELPADRPRPPVQTFNGAGIRFELDAHPTRGIHDVCRSSDVTLFMTLYAEFATLLSRFSGEEDIVVGSPIANRNHEQVEHLIGFFVNTLALREDLGGDPSFSTLLNRVRKTTLDAYEHQDLPFEKLVDELNVDRSLSHSPLFQVMFSMQKMPVDSFDIAGLTLSLFEIETDVAQFDLTLSMEEKDDELEGVFEYNTDLFHRTTIERMARGFETLLVDIEAHPGKRISDLSVMTDAEMHRLIATFNDAASCFPEDKCIHQLFEERTAETPDALAVVLEEGRLTCGELNERANRLGRYLQKRGVGPETLVGLCMERSIDMIVGLLGILKAGGAYVPLDPGYPRERLAFMLK